MNKSIEVVEIKVAATPGSSSGKCQQEAMKLAVEEWRNVRLFHNGEEYLVMPNEPLAAIKKV